MVSLTATCIEVRMGTGARPTVVSLSGVSCVALVLLVLVTLGVSASIFSSWSSASYQWNSAHEAAAAHAQTALFDSRARTLNHALLELSRRIEVQSSAQYNMPVAPWLPDCAAFYTRTDGELQALVAKAQRLHARAIDRKSKEQLNYVAELKLALAAKSDKWMPALSAWLTPELDRVDFWPRPADLECTRHAVVMIEGRGGRDVLFMIRHTFFMLQQDTQAWGLVLFHGPDNDRELHEALQVWPGGRGQHIRMVLINETRIDRNMGNKAIVAPALWAHVPVENVLLLQTDGLMLKPPSTNLTLWHELTNQYVYVGAPFPEPKINPHPAFNGFGHHEHTPFGGNGGVSFRKKSVMLQIARSLKCTNADSKIGDCFEEHIFPLTADVKLEYTDDEDRWIGRQLWKHSWRYRGRIPFYAKARLFAVDMIYYHDPFFCHKYWQAELDHHLVERAEILGLVAMVKTYYMRDVGPPLPMATIAAKP